MKVSIIVPVYNTEKYLVRCLDSLVGQTLKECEVILINDGSKDSSGEILRKYAEKYPEKVKYLTVENGGQGRARNIGLSVATGEYIGYVDSDDWVDLSMYEKLYTAAVENEADMSLCDCIECYEDGRTVYSELTAYEHPMHINAAVWNKLFKKSVIQDIVFPQGLWYEDLAYVINFMLKEKRIVPVKEGLYFYRIGQISTMTNNNSKKNLDIIEIMDGLKENMLPNRNEEFETLILGHVLLDTINRVAAHDNSEKRQVLGELRDYIHKNIPQLSSCSAYRNEPWKKKLIMFLNYNGMENISQFIFRVNRGLRKMCN